VYNNNVEEVGLQALSPVTLMITLLLSSLKSGAKVQLIIDIDKEKGIYLAKIRFSCNIISKRKRPCELSQSRFRILQELKKRPARMIRRAL
jgi:hypothetical protein